MIKSRRAQAALLTVVWSACGGGTPSQTGSGADPGAPATPAPVTSPASSVFITNETSGDLSIIDAVSHAVVATIPLGKRPRGLVVSPDRSTLYVALSGSPPAPPGVDEKTLPPPDRSADGIGVVDLASRKLVKVLPSGTDPEVVAVTADGRRLIVANEDAAKASIVDATSGQIL
jgi:YVTN family beta-propeller protein